MKAERRRKSLAAKKSRILEDFLDLSTENKEISKVLYSCFVWSMKSVERVFQTIIVQEAKFILSKEILQTVNEFAFCLLIGQIGSSFFLWKKCFVSQLFFLAFKRTLLIVLLQVRRMKVKATMRQILFGQKIEGKGKKLQYG